jgi:hypothetical protein
MSPYAFSKLVNNLNTDKPMGNQLTYVGTRVPREVREWIEERSEAECRTISNFVAKVLTERREREQSARSDESSPS